MSCLPNLESFSTGNRTPCLDSHHLQRFMLASQASWPPAHPRSPYTLILWPFSNTTQHQPPKCVTVQLSFACRAETCSLPCERHPPAAVSADTSRGAATLGGGRTPLQRIQRDFQAGGRVQAYCFCFTGRDTCVGVFLKQENHSKVRSELGLG